jgi:hypothetical protein
MHRILTTYGVPYSNAGSVKNRFWEHTNINNSPLRPHIRLTTMTVLVYTWAHNGERSSTPWNNRRYNFILAKTASNTPLYRRIVKRTQPAIRCPTIKNTLTTAHTSTHRQAYILPRMPQAWYDSYDHMEKFCFWLTQAPQSYTTRTYSPHLDALLSVHNAPHAKAWELWATKVSHQWNYTSWLKRITKIVRTTS